MSPDARKTVVRGGARSLVALSSAVLLGVIASAACSSQEVQPAHPDAGARDAGCAPPTAVEGDDPCTAALTPGSDRKCTFEVGGQERSFLVYAPKSYDPCAPAAVVVDAHGATESAEQHAGLEPFRTWPAGLGSGWRVVADRKGFVVVTPQGIGNFWNENDVDYLVEVDARVRKIARVDPARVYLTGISNGGFLSYWAACRDLDIFRGFAPIAGSASSPGCKISRPAPLIAFHAKGDTVVPYAGGKRGAEGWAKSNGCKKGPTPSLTFGGKKADARELCLASEAGDKWRLAACGPSAPETTCQTWDECDGGVKVTLCDVPGEQQPVGGHILYFNDTKLSLAAVTWEFFEQSAGGTR